MRETQETQVPSLGRRDPLGRGNRSPLSILAWEIQWTEGPGGCSVTVHRGAKSRTLLSDENNNHVENVQVSSSILSFNKIY